MAEAPRYRDGHAIVAAIRVHDAKTGRPPTTDEMAALLGWHPDVAGVVTRGLEQLGIIKALENPYEVRYEVRDHLALEKLEDDEQGAGFADELSEFSEKVEQEQQRLESLFHSGEVQKAQEERVRNLDEEFKQFRKGKPDNPFGGK